MKVSKSLKKLIDRAVGNSFSDSGLKTDIVKKYVTAFKKMNLSDSIQTLTLYSRGLKRVMEEHTLFIESAGEMTGQQVKEIQDTFTKGFKLYNVETKLNPSLLGGIKVKMGDLIFDYSLKSKINQVKEAIIG